MDVSLKECCEFFKKAEDAFIFCHRNPDGDTLGSAFALHYILKEIGIRSKVLCSDGFPKQYGYLMREYEPEEFEPKTLVAVDIADDDLLGEALAEYRGKIDLCIDHHENGKNYAKKRLVRGGAAATAEIIEDVLEELGAKLSPLIADCIYTGVSTDTGCFRYSNTTEKSHNVAGKMFFAGCNFPMINYTMFEMKSLSRIALERELLGTIEYHSGGKCAAAYITSEMMEKTGADNAELEGVASIPREIEGVEVGITFRQRDDGWKISVRTSDDVDAAAICKALGGGGHRCAAGCFIAGSLEAAKKAMLEAAKKALAELEEG